MKERVEVVEVPVYVCETCDRDYKVKSDIESCRICGSDYCSSCSIPVGKKVITRRVLSSIYLRYPGIHFMCRDCYDRMVTLEEEIVGKVVGERGKEEEDSDETGD